MSPTTTLNIATGHLVRIESDFNVSKEWKIIPHGINWQNGYLDVESGEFLDHRYDR